MNIKAIAIGAMFLCTNAGAEAVANGAGENHPFSKVEMVYESDGCSFEASPVNFCDEKHLVTYKDALNTRGADFAGHYMLLSLSEWPTYHQRSVVAIDVNTGIVYPLPIDAYSGVGDSKGVIHSEGTLEYKVGDGRLCIKGAILVYRAIQEGTFCFTFQDNKFAGYHTEYMN